MKYRIEIEAGSDAFAENPVAEIVASLFRLCGQIVRDGRLSRPIFDPEGRRVGTATLEGQIQH